MAELFPGKTIDVIAVDRPDGGVVLEIWDVTNAKNPTCLQRIGYKASEYRVAFRKFNEIRLAVGLPFTAI